MRPPKPAVLCWRPPSSGVRVPVVRARQCWTFGQTGSAALLPGAAVRTRISGCEGVGCGTESRVDWLRRAVNTITVRELGGSPDQFRLARCWDGRKRAGLIAGPSCFWHPGYWLHWLHWLLAGRYQVQEPGTVAPLVLVVGCHAACRCRRSSGQCWGAGITDLASQEETPGKPWVADAIAGHH